jgi:hypothetical protein
MGEWGCNGISIGYRTNNIQFGYVVDQMGLSWDIVVYHGDIYIYMDIKGDVVETKHVFGCV